MKYDPQKHHRRSIRLKGYDYTRRGAYFITICTWQKKHLFSEIIAGNVKLNRYGEVVQYNWFDLNRRYSYLHLDAFIVMPNHVHGIILLIGDRLNPRGLGAGLESPSVETNISGEPAVADPRGVGAGLESLCAGNTNIAGEPAPTVHGDRAKSKSAKCCGLPEIIQGFKTCSATRINQLRRTTGVPVWQRNYYERIIRNDVELQNIRKYIMNNPLSWQQDELYKNLQ